MGVRTDSLLKSAHVFGSLAMCRLNMFVCFHIIVLNRKWGMCNLSRLLNFLFNLSGEAIPILIGTSCDSYRATSHWQPTCCRIRTCLYDTQGRVRAAAARTLGSLAAKNDAWTLYHRHRGSQCPPIPTPPSTPQESRKGLFEGS